MLPLAHHCDIRMQQMFSAREVPASIVTVKLQDIFLRFFFLRRDGQKTLAHSVHVRGGSQKSANVLIRRLINCATGSY